MFVNLLVFVAAIILEVLGAYMAVVGLSSKSSVLLVVLAISLDFAKIVIASVIYKYWKELNWLFKFYLVPTLLFLMSITSYGSYAYLLQEFSKTTLKQEQIISKLESLEKESTKLTARKQDIDQQIATVNPTYITQKKRLTDMFAKELTQVNERLVDLDKEIPETKELMLKNQTETGTLMALAKSWGTTADQTAKIIALMMVLVIDPLAIILLMVGTFLNERRKQETILKLAKKEEEREEREQKEQKALLLKQAMEEKEKNKEKEVLSQLNELDLQKSVTAVAEDKVEEKIVESQGSVASVPSYKFKATNLNAIQSSFIPPIASPISNVIVDSGNQEIKEQTLQKTESFSNNDNVVIIGNMNEELEIMENNSTEPTEPTEQLIENISNESNQLEVQEVPESTSLYNEENTYVAVEDEHNISENSAESITNIDEIIQVENKVDVAEIVNDDDKKDTKNVWQKTAPSLDVAKIKEQMTNNDNEEKKKVQIHNSWNKEDPFHPENNNLQTVLSELDYLTPEVKESDKK